MRNIKPAHLVWTSHFPNNSRLSVGLAASIIIFIELRVSFRLSQEIPVHAVVVRLGKPPAAHSQPVTASPYCKLSTPCADHPPRLSRSCFENPRAEVHLGVKECRDCGVRKQHNGTEMKRLPPRRSIAATRFRQRVPRIVKHLLLCAALQIAGPAQATNKYVTRGLFAQQRHTPSATIGNWRLDVTFFSALRFLERVNVPSNFSPVTTIHWD